MPVYIAQWKERTRALCRFARRLAALSVRLREEIAVERVAFQQQFAVIAALCPHAQPEEFADILAQTICYGVFLVRCHQCEPGPVTLPYVRDRLRAADAELAPLFLVSTPVMAELMALCNGRELAELPTADTLCDPAVACYEPFLAACAPEARGRHGVYLTPRPLVTYMVRSVEALLQQEFSLREGLRDARVLVFDPAVGSGAFLRGVIEQARVGRSTGEVRLPRCLGCEVLPAAYLIARLSLGLLNAGALLLQVDTLDEPEHWLARMPDAEIPVILGNPPYDGYAAARDAGTRGEDLADLAVYFQLDGQPLGEKNARWLHDDYVRFIRLGQALIARRGAGVLAFVTNHGYLDNPTFRGMRRSLLGTFDALYLLDLHGNRQKNARRLDHDENVFAIRSGVAIGLFVKRPARSATPVVRHASQSGLLTEYTGGTLVGGKFHWLSRHDVTSTAWTALSPTPPGYLFVPETHAGAYADWWPLTAIMPEYSLGMLTKRDALAVGFAPEELQRQLAAFTDLSRSAEACAAHFGLPLRDRDRWDLVTVRAALAGDLDVARIRPLLYRPFDVRYVYADPRLIARPNTRVLRHLAQPNLALLVGRQGAATGAREWDVVFVTDGAVEQNLFRRGGATVFPLYLYADQTRRANLSPVFIAACAERLRLRYLPDGRGDLLATFGPEDIAYYLYALLQAPGYRRRYADALQYDFPRLPLPSRTLLRDLAGHGEALVNLHRLATPLPACAEFPRSGSNRVETVRYQPPDRLYLNDTQYVTGITPAVWEFHLGGYPICRKWLHDRRGRILASDEINRYLHVIAVIAETLRIQRMVEVVFEKYEETHDR